MTGPNVARRWRMGKRFRGLVAVACMGVLAACSVKDMPPPPESGSSAPDEYRIGPEDRLKIDVWKQPEMSVATPVRSDGKISVPLAGDIMASGMTPSQLKDKLTVELGRFIEDPTVSVMVEEINSLKISVAGSVLKPGIYKVGKRVSVVEAISLAGGLDKLADARKIRIIRKSGNEEKMYQVDFIAILNGDIRQNVLLMPGDSVVVP
jgi:polysaccharide export outer membrane protein